MIRVLFFSRIEQYYLKQCLQPEAQSCMTELLGEDREPIKGALGQLRKVEQQILSCLPQNDQNWLIKNHSKDKLYDISYLTELLLKIGTEEEDQYYQEFMIMLVDLLYSVFYCQQQRKGVHFSKYKKLFRLIGEEMKADAAGTASRIKVENGKLWFALEEPLITQEVKK